MLIINRIIWKFLFLAVCLVFWQGCSNSEFTDTQRTYLMGFTPFPWDYSEEAVQETNRAIVQSADIISQHLEQGVPWSEALEEKPFHPNLMADWKTRKEASANKKIFLSLNPLNEGRNGICLCRGEKEKMPLPDAFQNKPLNDPIIKKAYLNYCLRAVEYFQPSYLAIGIEVNELFHNSPDQWPAFAELYKETYAEVKKKYPELPVFATLSLHNLTNTGWKDINAQQKAVQDLLVYSDIVGISYYPFMAGQSVRPNYTLHWLEKFTNKPIAITETGYPAEKIELPSFKVTIPGSPALQKQYMSSILHIANQDRYLFVIAFLYRDYDALWEKIKSSSPEAFVVWKDCGMLDGQGTPRPALGVWKKYYALPVVHKK